MSRLAGVVTTDSIEGWRIAEYKGLVTAHVVAGTGFFSDFAASFSDVFGGRSGTYQKQLASLQEEVIAILSQRAMRVGANWVIGVRIDFDEISGKSKQMFMVSAHGTAVNATQDEARQVKRGADSAGLVTADELAASVVRARLVRQSFSGGLDFTETCWKDLVEHRIEEAVIPALKKYNTLQSYEADPFWQRCFELVRSLPIEAAQQQLHKAMVEANDLVNNALKIIKALNLTDLNWALQQLRGSESRLQYTALQLLRADSPTYDRKALELMKEIVDALPLTFPDRSTLVEKKGLFAKQGAQQWKCQCSHPNDLDNRYCSKCNRDRRGILDGDLSVEDAVRGLCTQIECLTSVLGVEENESGTKVGEAMPAFGNA